MHSAWPGGIGSAEGETKYPRRRQGVNHARPTRRVQTKTTLTRTEEEKPVSPKNPQTGPQSQAGRLPGSAISTVVSAA